jgi:O-antigen/teichoic acid export membrane protein
MPAFRSQFALNILSNLSGNALNSVLQLGLIVTLSHCLTTPAYAAYLTAASIIGICDIASDFGARLWSVREFSTSTHPGRTLRHAIACKAFYTLIAVAILAFLPLSTLQLHQFLLSALIAATQPGTDPFLWYMRGRDRLDVEAALLVVFRFAMAATMVISAVLGADLTVLLILWLTCNILRMVMESRLQIMRPLFENTRLEQSAETLSHFAQTIRKVFPIGASLVLTTLYHQTGVLLLSVFGTDEDVSLFGTGFKLVMPVGFIATSVVVSSFAPLTKAIKSGDTEASRAIISKKMLLLTGLLAPICLLGTVLSVPVARILFDTDQAAAGIIMVLLMPGFYLTCINRGIKFTLNAYSMDWQDTCAIITGGIAFISVTLFSPIESWPLRAVLGWSIGETCIFTLRIILLRLKQHHRGIPLGVIGAMAAILIAVVLTMRPTVPATIVDDRTTAPTPQVMTVTETASTYSPH